MSDANVTPEVPGLKKKVVVAGQAPGSAAAGSVAPKEKAVKTPKAPADPRTEKYPALKASFWRGQLPGQINSAHKAKDENAAKSADFAKAVAAGDIKLEAMSITLANKCREIGINVPQDLVIPASNRGRQADAAAPEGTPAAE
jgi:hypothetical protein